MERQFYTCLIWQIIYRKHFKDKVTKTLRHHFLNLILKLYKNNSDKFEHCTSNK